MALFLFLFLAVLLPIGLNLAAAVLALMSLTMMVMGSICIVMSLSKGVPFFLKPASFCFILSGGIRVTSHDWSLARQWLFGLYDELLEDVPMLSSTASRKHRIKWFYFNLCQPSITSLHLRRHPGPSLHPDIPPVSVGPSVQWPLHTCTPWAILVCGVCWLFGSYPHFWRSPFHHPLASFQPLAEMLAAQEQCHLALST